MQSGLTEAGSRRRWLCELRKRIDSSQFRGSVPMPTRQSVRCAPSRDSTLGGARR